MHKRMQRVKAFSSCVAESNLSKRVSSTTRPTEQGSRLAATSMRLNLRGAHAVQGQARKPGEAQPDAAGRERDAGGGSAASSGRPGTPDVAEPPSAGAAAQWDVAPPAADQQEGSDGFAEEGAVAPDQGPPRVWMFRPALALEVRGGTRKDFAGV